MWSYGEIIFFKFYFSRSVIPCRTVNQPSIHVKEMDPNFVVTTLILFLETQRAVRDGEGAVHADLPLFF